jgi:hypothetical protein
LRFFAESDLTPEQEAIHALHNAVRHYCVERIAYWHKRYAELGKTGGDRVTRRDGSWTYTAEAYGIFPRYNVIAAILSDIEHYVPDDFASIEKLREVMALASETAQNPFTKDEKNSVEAAVKAEERRLCAQYALNLDPAKLGRVPWLPFRRVLADDEHKRWHRAFAQRWGQWYGGAVQPKDGLPPQVVLHTEAMALPHSYDKLRAIIIQKGITRVLELREWGDGFELDTAGTGFCYNGAEGFWATPDLSWMVQASHESSITFGGSWLIDAMRSALLEFDRYVYKGWDLKNYPPFTHQV